MIVDFYLSRIVVFNEIFEVLFPEAGQCCLILSK